MKHQCSVVGAFLLATVCSFSGGYVAAQLDEFDLDFPSDVPSDYPSSTPSAVPSSFPSTLEDVLENEMAKEEEAAATPILPPPSPVVETIPLSSLTEVETTPESDVSGLPLSTQSPTADTSTAYELWFFRRHRHNGGHDAGHDAGHDGGHDGHDDVDTTPSGKGGKGGKGSKSSSKGKKGKKIRTRKLQSSSVQSRKVQSRKLVSRELQLELLEKVYERFPFLREVGEAIVAELIESEFGTFSDAPSDMPSDAPSDMPSDAPSAIMPAPKVKKASSKDPKGKAPKRKTRKLKSSTVGSSELHSRSLPSGENQSRELHIPPLLERLFERFPFLLRFYNEAEATFEFDSLSDSPSEIPSDVPSMMPSDQPSLAPSDAPSLTPSDSPSDQPSDSPSTMPSDAPSSFPSDVPSSFPSDVPSSFPSDVPSSFPSSVPSDSPSMMPSDTPSALPSDSPSMTPSRWADKQFQLPEGYEVCGLSEAVDFDSLRKISVSYLFELSIYTISSIETVQSQVDTLLRAEVLDSTCHDGAARQTDAARVHAISTELTGMEADHCGENCYIMLGQVSLLVDPTSEADYKRFYCDAYKVVHDAIKEETLTLVPGTERSNFLRDTPNLSAECTFTEGLLVAEVDKQNVPEDTEKVSLSVEADNSLPVWAFAAGVGSIFFAVAGVFAYKRGRAQNGDASEDSEISHDQSEP